jgi:hypothetical protein
MVYGMEYEGKFDSDTGRSTSEECLKLLRLFYLIPSSQDRAQLIEIVKLYLQTLQNRQ